MPIYTYKCNRCEREYEKMQSIYEEPDLMCFREECQGIVNRIIKSSPAIIFKGSGWTPKFGGG